MSFEDGEEADNDGTNVGSGGHGIYRHNPRKEDFRDYGSEYRAKVRVSHNNCTVDAKVLYLSAFQKAKGDLKKQGQLDPYAYIPLNRERLNRRKRAKMRGEFSNVMMRRAKRGSSTGTKLHSKRKKKMQ